MQLEDAISQSPVNSAFVPYYTVTDGLRQKLIITVGNLDYVYVIWADTKEYVNDLKVFEGGKVTDRNDWQPVSPGAAE